MKNLVIVESPSKSKTIEQAAKADLGLMWSTTLPQLIR